MHLKLCNCDHFPNLVPDGPPPDSRFLAAMGAAPIPYALSGCRAIEEGLFASWSSVAGGHGIRG